MAEEDTLLREVNEAVRHDKLMALWRQYRMPVLAVALLLVVATAGGSLWGNYKDARAGEAMRSLALGQEQFYSDAFDEAAKNFAATADVAMTGELRDLAQLWQARAWEASGKVAEALPLLERVATAPEGKDLTWRDLACLRLVARVPEKSACLSANPSSPLAAERALVKAAQLWKQGESDKAVGVLNRLAKSSKQSDAVRTRAQLYLSVLAASARQG